MMKFLTQGAKFWERHGYHLNGILDLPGEKKTQNFNINYQTMICKENLIGFLWSLSATIFLVLLKLMERSDKV